MSMLPSSLRSLLVLPFAVLLTYSPACSEDHHGSSSNPDVVYEAETNDEALQTLLAAPAAKDPARGPWLSSPTSGAKISKASPMTFEWKGMTASLDRPASTRQARWTFDAALGPMRRASAHGTPLSGVAYLLVVTSADNPQLLRVFTKNTTYKPDDATWSRLTKATGPLSAIVTTASFDNNNLVQGSGPFASDAVPFTLE